MQIKNFIKTQYRNLLIRQHRKPLNYAPSNHACILPAAQYGSLGDEAMVISLAGLLLANGNVLSVIDYNLQDKWGVSYPNIFTNSSTLPGGIKEWDSFITFLSAQDVFYINGADVLDGKYSINDSLDRLKIATLASELGLAVVITGFSFNKMPPAAIVNYIKDMPTGIQFCCRDIHSYNRFIEFTGRKAEQVADLAFILEPDHDSHYVYLIKKWIELKRQEGHHIIALTPNVLFKKELFDQDVTYYTKILTKINEIYPCSFLLIPHDYRSKPSDLDCIKAIQVLCGNLDILLVDKLCSARELKAVASYLDLSVTGRMHFAIACLSSGVPVCGLSYQDKFDGVFEMLGQQNCLIDSQSIAETDIIFEKISNIVNNIHKFNRDIGKRLPSISSMSRKNLLAI
jgi:polysaccharide pyruvyl transferase WcaK-like protein